MTGRRPEEDAPRRSSARGTRPSMYSGGRVTACTFDCYGTLIDWRAGIDENLGQMLRDRGYHGAESVYEAYTTVERQEETRYASYRTILATSAIRVGERLRVRLPAEDARRFAESLPSWPAFEDTVEGLRALGRLGIRRIILSNVDRALLEATLRRSHIEVDGFVTAEDVRSYKPEGAHWLRYFQEYPEDRGTTWHVAHSWFHDIVPAQRLGLPTVWVDRYSEPRPRSVRPDFTVRDLRGLIRLVRRNPTSGADSTA